MTSTWTWQNWLLIGDTAFIVLYALAWLLGQAKTVANGLFTRLAAATAPTPVAVPVPGQAPAAVGPTVVIAPPAAHP